jgi:hypothetical protein
MPPSVRQKAPTQDISSVGANHMRRKKLKDLEFLETTSQIFEIYFNLLVFIDLRACHDSGKGLLNTRGCVRHCQMLDGQSIPP